MEFLNALVSFVLLIAFMTLSSVLASMEDLQKLPAANRQNVDIKPGAGRQEIVEKLEGFVCKFQYKAQGGTKEEWSLSILSNPGRTEWLCTIERPSGHSYLFFEEFKLEVKGAKLKNAVLEKEPGVALSDVEYTISSKKNYVQHSPGKFNSQLTKVQAYATSTGREL